MKTNIQKQKQFLIFIIIAFLTFSCIHKKEKPFKIKAILEGVYIEDYCLYAYSDDFYSLNNDTFSLRSKIEYDMSNCLSFFVLYKPEGALEYTKDDVLNDPSLLYFTNGTYIQNWKNINDTLLFNGLDTLKVKSYINETGNKFMINWKDDDVIIFELY
jgi:hypothetical protein